MEYNEVMEIIIKVRKMQENDDLLAYTRETHDGYSYLKVLRAEEIISRLFKHECELEMDLERFEMIDEKFSFMDREEFLNQKREEIFDDYMEAHGETISKDNFSEWIKENYKHHDSEELRMIFESIKNEGEFALAGGFLISIDEVDDLLDYLIEDYDSCYDDEDIEYQIEQDFDYERARYFGLQEMDESTQKGYVCSECNAFIRCEDSQGDDLVCPDCYQKLIIIESIITDAFFN